MKWIGVLVMAVCLLEPRAARAQSQAIDGTIEGIAVGSLRACACARSTRRRVSRVATTSVSAQSPIVDGSQEDQEIRSDLSKIETFSLISWPSCDP